MNQTIALAFHFGTSSTCVCFVEKCVAVDQQAQAFSGWMPVVLLQILILSKEPRMGSDVCLLFSSSNIQSPKLPFTKTTMCHQEQTFVLFFVGSTHSN